MNLKDKKTTILESGLADVPFDGWSTQTFEQAAVQLGEDPMVVSALFPRGEADLIQFFSIWADEKMLDALKDIDIENLRVRDRIKLAVETRIGVLSPYKESVNVCFKKLLMPNHTRLAASITWASADTIWNWAGDTSTDYNRYTKRFLLGGVISTTMTYWFQDQSEGAAKTYEFLDRRIENVLFIGKNTGKLIKPIANITKYFVRSPLNTQKNKDQKV